MILPSIYVSVGIGIGKNQNFFFTDSDSKPWIPITLYVEHILYMNKITTVYSSLFSIICHSFSNLYVYCLTLSCLEIPLSDGVWMTDTFEDNSGMTHKFENYFLRKSLLTVKGAM